MEQNGYHSEPRLSDEIKRRIDRILEEMRIEGISVLEFPEQLLAILIIEIFSNPERFRWRVNPFLHEGEREKAAWVFDDVRKNRYKNTDLGTTLAKIQLISSRQVLINLWELGERLCALCPELAEELEQAFAEERELRSGFLAELMDYLVEAIHHRENKGIFFTPYHLAILVTELVDPGKGKIWDPSFGSGTLLIQAAERAKQNGGSCQIAGNEINHRMVHFARVNAFYHGMLPELVEFKETDTIEEARRTGYFERYDYILANPPVSSVSDNAREEFGFLAPTRKLHLQFLQVILERLKENGRAAVFVNESFLFGGSRAEKKIREAIVEHYGLRAVISLPQGAFAPYTNAKASILFLDRSLAHEQPVSFYELKTLGYTLYKRRQPILENDVPKVLEAEADREKRYMEWTRQIALDSEYNEQGIVVPSDWQYETGWFMKREDIRDKAYNLMGNVYSIAKKELRKPEASPKELLQKLNEMERESAVLLEKILELDL